MPRAQYINSYFLVKCSYSTDPLDPIKQGLPGSLAQVLPLPDPAKDTHHDAVGLSGYQVHATPKSSPQWASYDFAPGASTRNTGINHGGGAAAAASAHPGIQPALHGRGSRRGDGCGPARDVLGTPPLISPGLEVSIPPAVGGFVPRSPGARTRCGTEGTLRHSTRRPVRHGAERPMRLGCSDCAVPFCASLTRLCEKLCHLQVVVDTCEYEQGAHVMNVTAYKAERSDMCACQPHTYVYNTNPDENMIEFGMRAQCQNIHVYNVRTFTCTMSEHARAQCQNIHVHNVRTFTCTMSEHSRAQCQNIHVHNVRTCTCTMSEHSRAQWKDIVHNNTD
jgi:hypothetical protein